MTKLVLDSVDTRYDVENNKIHSVENYIPIDPKSENYDENFWDIRVDGIVSYAVRNVLMHETEYKSRKAFWQKRGVPVRNARGDEILKRQSPNKKTGA